MTYKERFNEVENALPAEQRYTYKTLCVELMAETERTDVLIQDLKAENKRLKDVLECTQAVMRDVY